MSSTTDQIVIFSNIVLIYSFRGSGNSFLFINLSQYIAGRRPNQQFSLDDLELMNCI